VPSDCSSLISSSPPSLLHLLRKTSPLIRRPWSAALESKNANCLTTPYSAPAPHGQRSDKVRAPQLHSLVPHCTPPGLSPTSVRTRVRFLHCYCTVMKIPDLVVLEKHMSLCTAPHPCSLNTGDRDLDHHEEESYALERPCHFLDLIDVLDVLDRSYCESPSRSMTYSLCP
jgi:hypothetical protein